MFARTFNSVDHQPKPGLHKEYHTLVRGGRGKPLISVMGSHQQVEVLTRPPMLGPHFRDFLPLEWGSRCSLILAINPEGIVCRSAAEDFSPLIGARIGAGPAISQPFVPVGRDGKAQSIGVSVTTVTCAKRAGIHRESQSVARQYVNAGGRKSSRGYFRRVVRQGIILGYSRRSEQPERLLRKAGRTGFPVGAAEQRSAGREGVGEMLGAVTPRIETAASVIVAEAGDGTGSA